MKKRNQIENSRKKLRWKWLNILKKPAIEFCRETGLHGYKYIGQTERSRTERIIWAIAVFASLCCAMVLMKFAWNYHASHPILSVIESTHHGIWNYPFPAVTICDINRVSLHLTEKLVERLKRPENMSKEFLVQEMRLVNELLYPGRFSYDIRSNLSQLQDIFDDNGLSIPDVIDAVTRSCQDLLEICKWKAQDKNCSQMFTKSVTRDGFCCSFNYITYETIVKKPNVTPKRVTACGHQTGVSVLLNFDASDYHATIMASVGIKLMLHDPYNYPDYNAAATLLGVGKYAFVTVKPEETYSTNNVRSLAVATRNCLYEDEEFELGRKNIERHFTSAKYSYLNCMTECRSTVIREKCGCIPYYYTQNSTRICNLRDLACLRTYKHWYDNSWPGINSKRTKLPDRTTALTNRPCKCMPDCNFYRYSVESSLGDLNKKTYYNNFKYTNHKSKGKSWKNHTIVHVFFGDLVSIQYRRNVHYNWRNLFASFGGLLGLFAGFSLMSVFELIYFFVIRVITDVCARGQMGNT